MVNQSWIRWRRDNSGTNRQTLSTSFTSHQFFFADLAASFISKPDSLLRRMSARTLSGEHYPPQRVSRQEISTWKKPICPRAKTKVLKKKWIKWKYEAMLTIGAAIMDTERIIPQNGGSPGSQNDSSSANMNMIGHPNSMGNSTNYNNVNRSNLGQYANSIARKKKSDRLVAPPPAPPHNLNHASSILEGTSPYHSYANTSGVGGLLNHGYAPENNRYVYMY